MVLTSRDNVKVTFGVDGLLECDLLSASYHCSCLILILQTDSTDHSKSELCHCNWSHRPLHRCLLLCHPKHQSKCCICTLQRTLLEQPNSALTHQYVISYVIIMTVSFRLLLGSPLWGTHCAMVLCWPRWQEYTTSFTTPN